MQQGSAGHSIAGRSHMHVAATAHEMKIKSNHLNRKQGWTVNGDLINLTSLM